MSAGDYARHADAAGQTLGDAARSREAERARYRDLGIKVEPRTDVDDFLAEAQVRATLALAAATADIAAALRAPGRLPMGGRS